MLVKDINGVEFDALGEMKAIDVSQEVLVASALMKGRDIGLFKQDSSGRSDFYEAFNGQHAY